jgi:hypothetical protein
MALSATIALSTASAPINQAVNGSITVSNSGGSAVTVLYCEPKAKMTGSASSELNTGLAVSQSVPLGSPLSVPASGSVVIPVTYVFFAPSGSSTYDCFGTLQTSDGSVFNPSPAATVTITPIPLPPSYVD